jgi:hypothetical protein
VQIFFVASRDLSPQLPFFFLFFRVWRLFIIVPFAMLKSSLDFPSIFSLFIFILFFSFIFHQLIFFIFPYFFFRFINTFCLPLPSFIRSQLQVFNVIVFFSYHFKFPCYAVSFIAFLMMTTKLIYQGKYNRTIETTQGDCFKALSTIFWG